MKYPKKKKGRIKVPYYSERDACWYYGFLNNDNTVERTCISKYHKEEHAWVCCNAYNNRQDYTQKEIKKIIKKFGSGERQEFKKEEKKKRRWKKAKK